jgi:death-on-curing family protein
MAAAYIEGFAVRHVFSDGNKRVALGAAEFFLHINGYEVTESRPEELADLVLGFLTKEITKDDIINHLQLHSKPIV